MSFRTLLTVLLPLCLGSFSALAGPIERALEARWRGAHVVLNVASRSHCNGAYTDNRVNGRLSQGRGSRAFGPGELGQIKNLDVKRSRVDVLVDIHEPILVPRHVGPFTLYDVRSCRVELEIEVPRALVRHRDVDAIDALLRAAMERHVTLADAQDSELWNGREREAYPHDYEETLAAFEVWKVEQHNLAVEQKLAESEEILAALAVSISSGRFYLEGFAEGVEAGRRQGTGSRCGTLVSLSLARPARDAPEGLGGDEQEQGRWSEGFADGVLLVRALRLHRSLPACFLPLPDETVQAGLVGEGSR